MYHESSSDRRDLIGSTAEHNLELCFRLTIRYFYTHDKITHLVI